MLLQHHKQSTPDSSFLASMQCSQETLSKYDVLAEPPIEGVSTEYSLEKHASHVGNQRFQVLMAMNQNSYEKARMNGDLVQCNVVVDQLVDTVCNQVVPRGRFLESSKPMIETSEEVQWLDMDEGIVKSLLHRLLRSAAEKPDESQDKASPVASPVVSQDNVERLTEEIRRSKILASLPDNEDSDEGQKRRRRSSLLRRSNSESMLGVFLDNRKKMNSNAFHPRGITQEEPTSWKQATPLGDLGRMDVVFAAERHALDPSCMSVGNNRLHVLAAVRSAAFKEGSLEEQEKILDEIIETVSTFWKGRFLVDIHGGYDEISHEEAREIIRMILSGRKNVIGRRHRHSDPTGSVPGLFQTGASGFSGSAKPVFAPSLPSALLSDTQKNQNRAILNLKNQKARNQNASRLQEKLGVKTKRDAAPEGSAPFASAQGQALFPLGGMINPSKYNSSQGNLEPSPIFSSTKNIPTTFNSLGYESTDVPTQLPRSSFAARRASTFKPRQSSVFGFIDAKMMGELAAELDDDSDYDDTF